ncbi:MAG: hypothetical protein KF696_14475 [Planctomycetes bacterium]|nr:hypothetical protein [Planctomycetota bacterium]MCW8136800.1 hypothetical protein [Planctomycetota bacterium]
MGEDEIMVTIASAIAALVMWGLWGANRRGMRSDFYPNASIKQLTLIGGIVNAGLLFMILKLWSSFDVRDSAPYLAQYWFMGAAFAAVAGIIISPLMGISHRDDVCERSNPAAAFAWLGVVAGFTIAYAGSNIGDGPGWWVVVFCTFVAYGFLLAVWFAFELAFHIAELVTVERDVAAGMRFGGLMLGLGIVAGRGAAGNWQGPDNAIADFLSVVVPALPLVVCAAIVELLLRPKAGAEVRQPALFGALPGLAFTLGGFFYVWLLKPW